MLLTAYEREEEKILDSLKEFILISSGAKALLTEMPRAEPAQMLEKRNELAKWADSDQDARLEALEAERAALRGAVRQGIGVMRKACWKIHRIDPIARPESQVSAIRRLGQKS